MSAPPTQPISNQNSGFSLLLAILFFLVAAFACYAPVLSPGYAVSDDFYHLARTMRASDWYSTLLATTNLQGRPLDGLLLGFVLPLMKTVSDFAYLRFISLLGVAGVALCSYFLLVRFGWRRAHAAFLSVIFTSIPAFQVLVSWSIASLYIFPAIGAYFAVWFGLKGLNEDLKRPVKIAYVGAAVISLFLALSLYQPTSMFYWLFVAITLFNDSAFTRETGKRAILMLVIFGLAAALNLAYFEGAKAVIGTASLLPQRSHLVTDIGNKVHWFVSEPLKEALNLNRLQASPKMAATLAFFLAGGLTLFFRGSILMRAAQLLLAFSLIVLSYLPNLAIAENFGTYRTQAGLEVLILFYFALAAKGVLRTLSGKSDGIIYSAGLSGLAALSIMVAHVHVLNFFVIPQTLELGLMKQQVYGEFGPAMEKHPLILKREETLAPFVRYDEFGLPSLAQSWVPEPVTFLLLKERPKDKTLVSSKAASQR
jgi:hypothetical protein